MGKTFDRVITSLYLFIPVALLAKFVLHNETLEFVAAALAIVPLARLMGHATEALAARAGSGLGAFLNSALGNAAELIVAFMALSKGKTDIVKASITGSIIGNLLFILGLSMFLGGLKRKEQKFTAALAESGAAMLFVAVAALSIPSIVERFSPEVASKDIFTMSLWTSGILLVTYGAGIFFSFRTHKHLYEDPEEEGTAVRVPLKKAILELVVSAALISVLAEFLVSSVEHASAKLGFSSTFVGVIVVAIVANAAEHFAAVTFAIKDKMNLSLGIAIESSKQIALFVAPVLVLSSLLFPVPLDLAFTAFEAAAIGMSVVIVALVSLDGKSNWLEGFMLLAVYAITGVAFYFTK
ncbi:MAG TPA: calcium/proton exchanger [Planctomycetota bacterium]|nr:calcium/proton exchanger [Planctomycetota bacterium]